MRDLELNNLALLEKMAWRIYDNPDSEVTNLLKEKYYSYSNIWTCGKKNRTSVSWRSILKGRDTVKSSIRWSIRDGRNVSVWNDPWMSNLPLSVIAEASNQNVPDLLVKDIINFDSRTWDLTAIDGFISERVAEEIKAISIGSDKCEDQVVWSHSKNGDIIVRDAYNFLISNKIGNILPDHNWRFLWKLNCPQKIKFSCGFFVTMDSI